MIRKNFGCLGLLLGAILCLSLLINLAFIVEKASHGTTGLIRSAPKFEESIVVEAKLPKDTREPESKIALIYLRGIITSAEPGALGETMVDDLKMQIEQAATDEKVKSIVL